MKAENMIFYRNNKDSITLHNMVWLMEHAEDEYYNLEDKQALFYESVSNLYELASENGFEGNLWHCYLTELLVYDENPYSIACELRGDVDGTLRTAILHDFRIFMQLFAYDFNMLADALHTGCFESIVDYHRSQKEGIKYNKRITKEINDFAVELANAATVEEFRDLVNRFYGSFGVGVFGLHKAFRVERVKEELHINPIYNIAITSLSDLVGYDIPKQKLIDNTEAFLEGRKSNNCLIYGDAGTGKSSSIRAILNQYYDKGLRMIEVYKHQYQELNDLIDRLKCRNYKFIIYMDDLSFEEFETEYKYLKAVIEGGLESKPDNVLIYATSNRRHLVKENFKDKDAEGGDIHKNETVQEKLSLFARFGVSIYFGAPDHQAFRNIITTLAARYELPYTEEELLLEANRWELSHSGLSGRTARQFIDYMRGKVKGYGNKDICGN